MTSNNSMYDNNNEYQFDLDVDEFEKLMQTIEDNKINFQVQDDITFIQTEMGGDN